MEVADSSLQSWTCGRSRGAHGSLLFGFFEEYLRLALECHDTVNTIGAEDAELAFVITAEVDEPAATLTSAG